MQRFFSQFGDITRFRLARNLKTGKSRHHAFIEFKDGEIVDIVAEAMNNYFLFGRKLICHVVPSEKVHERLFSAKKRFHVIPHKKIAKEAHNKERTYEQQQQRVKKLLRKESKMRRKLEDLGIDYKFDGYKAQAPKKATRKQLT